MRVYEYDADVNKYDGVTASTKGDRVLAKIKGTPLASTWKPVTVTIDVQTGRMGDFPSPAGHFFPVFGARAWQMLEPAIGGFVEALPLRCKEGTFFAINVLKVADWLDEEKSQLARVSSGNVYRIERYAFKRDVTPDAPIFRVPQHLSDVLVTDAFRELVTKNKLKGLLWHALREIG